MLSDCISKDRSTSELFIVGRGTVGILAKAARDRDTQAVLALSEGLIGVSEKDIGDALDDEEWKGMVAALGAGICLGGEEPWNSLRLDCLRYGKIIVATDETPLGLAFRNEVLALLRRFMPPLITEGFVFTSSLSTLALTSEEEFEKAVMSPATRNLRPFG